MKTSPLQPNSLDHNRPLSQLGDMSYIMVDIEADGPTPGIDLYSMISIGAIVVREPLVREDGFFCQLRPISDKYQQEALDVTKVTRKETLTYPDPAEGIRNFAAWIEKQNKGRPIFVSDNNGFDWQFINNYFWRYLGKNPFGHSSRNFQDLYKGQRYNVAKDPKHLRQTPHTHHPLDDVMGNAEALLYMKKTMGLSIDFK